MKGDSKAQRLAAAARHAQAEAACHAALALFATLADDADWQAAEAAPKYAQMTAVYFRRLRNGKVLSVTDFNTAAEVCTCARRALRALDPELRFDHHPQGDALRRVAADCYQVLAEHHRLKK